MLSCGMHHSAVSARLWHAANEFNILTRLLASGCVLDVAETRELAKNATAAESQSRGLANIRAYNLAMFHEARPLREVPGRLPSVTLVTFAYWNDGANLKHTSIKSSWQTEATLLRALRYCAALLRRGLVGKSHGRTM